MSYRTRARAWALEFVAVHLWTSCWLARESDSFAPQSPASRPQSGMDAVHVWGRERDESCVHLIFDLCLLPLNAGIARLSWHLLHALVECRASVVSSAANNLIPSRRCLTRVPSRPRPRSRHKRVTIEPSTALNSSVDSRFDWVASSREFGDEHLAEFRPQPKLCSRHHSKPKLVY